MDYIEWNIIEFLSCNYYERFIDGDFSFCTF